MKRSRRCPKCGGVRIGRLPGLPDTVGQETELRVRFLGMVKEGDRYRGVGRLEAYVCAGCGYVETYVVNPQSGDFEAAEGFSWVLSEAGPYR